MIVRLRPDFLTLMFTIRGSIVPRIAPIVLVLACFATLVAFLHTQQVVVLPHFALAPFTILGIALSLFLGFRNQAAYDRWWEARKLWGDMIFEIRSLARSSETLLNLEAEQTQAGELRRELLSWVAAHTHALRASVRAEDCSANMIAWLVKNMQDMRLLMTMTPTIVYAALGALLACFIVRVILIALVCVF